MKGEHGGSGGGVRNEGEKCESERQVDVHAEGGV